MAEYSSKWRDKINELAAQIQNRGPFQYDFDTDAMAKNLRAQAILGGQRAMADTMARASAMTGGQLSSYSQAVGQQQYNRYLQDLSGQMMGLAELAMERYDREGDDLRDRLGYLQGEDAKDYGRWKDAENARLQAEQEAYRREQILKEEKWRQEQEEYKRAQDAADRKWREDQEAYDREQDKMKWEHMLEREAYEDALREAAMGGGGGGGGGGSRGGRGGGGGGGGRGDFDYDAGMLEEYGSIDGPSANSEAFNSALEDYVPYVPSVPSYTDNVYGGYTYTDAEANRWEQMEESAHRWQNQSRIPKPKPKPKKPKPSYKPTQAEKSRWDAMNKYYGGK